MFSKAILLIICLVAQVLEIQGGEIPKEEQQRVELVIEQLKSEQARIWPTLSWKSAPILITFENGHVFALGLASKNAGWQVVKMKGERVLFSEKESFGLEGIQMQPLFEIEGEQAFVYKMGITASALEDVTIFAHERFHRHQAEHFVMREPQGMARDQFNEENLLWSEIEDQLLRDFLAADGENKREILQDFVAVTSMRREAIEPPTKLWENGQLRMEGLADYASTKGYGGEGLLLAMHPEKDHEEDFVDEVIKWRHYLAGASIGYALDFLAVPGWKEKVESGEVLPDLLIQAMPLTKPEQEKRLKKVAERLNYKKRRKAMADRLKKYREALDQLFVAYDKQEGVQLFIDHPPSGISGGGSNEKMVYLDNGSIVAINDASVSTTNDGHWVLKTDNVSHLFQHSNGVREVKIESVAKVRIDQVSLTFDELNKGPKEYPFTSLAIESENVSFSSKIHGGVLILDETGLHVNYR